MNELLFKLLTDRRLLTAAMCDAGVQGLLRIYFVGDAKKD
jgi:hypothetical protein